MIMPFRRKRILLVEDNPDSRWSLVRALEMEGYEVLQSSDGQAALNLMEESTPDLIVSDVRMPRMDGIEFFKAVRQCSRWLTIPFIFLTAHDTPADIQAGRILGAEDYLTKPIQADDLLAIVNARLLRSAEIQIAQINQAYLETVNVLANTIEGRDPYTSGHVERVADYARRLAQALGWSPEPLRVLEFGARLHDIGKVIVPDEILKKPGPLTDEEWALMKRHPLAGAEILRGIEHLRDVIPYVLYHHERWDGSGYPFGKCGEEIPLEGRLLSVVDVYDALTSARPYRPGRPAVEVVRFLQLKTGVDFDPRLIPVFLKVLAMDGKATS